MANLITILRILASAALLFCPALSPAFFAVYIFAGVTDMLDGFVAGIDAALGEGACHVLSIRPQGGVEMEVE